MNFAENVRKEIVLKPIKEEHCKRAFLAGIIRGSGAIYSNDDAICFMFRLKDDETVTLVTEYLKTLFNYDVREVSVSEKKKQGERFTVYVEGKIAEDILKDLEIIQENGEDFVLNLKFFGDITKRECCLHCFMKGLFVASGTCILPSENSVNTGYHLEIPFSHAIPASDTADKLAKAGIPVKIMLRRGKYVLYIKSVEQIKDFLAYLPTPVSVLNLTDFMIERELMNKSNRQKNCDMANVEKQVEASTKQIDAVNKIRKRFGKGYLKPDLEQVADIRLKYPEDTLNELAEKLNISKSCLNHRLRKIILKANEIQG